MIAVDTSALVAILRDEDDAEMFEARLNNADGVVISAATFVEVAIVIDAIGDPVLSRRLDELLRLFDVRMEPVTVEQATIARSAYRGYGKGSGHRAGLSFGDCFSYALAADRDIPLLFKGDDFSYTDLGRADS